MINAVDPQMGARGRPIEVQSLKSFEEWIRSKEIAPIPMEREKSKWENENEGGKFY